MKRIVVDLVMVVGIMTLFMAALLISNYLHYGTFLF